MPAALRPWGIPLLLAGLAWWQPLALYLVALACCGLPHVGWELAWLQQRGALRLPRGLGVGLGAALLLQMGGRLGFALGGLDALGAVAADLFSLLILLGLGLLLMRSHAARPALLALPLLAAALPLAALLSPDPQWAVGLVILLSVAHNFTPLGLAAGLDSPDARRHVRRLFLLPLGLLLIPGTPSATPGPLAPAELGWLEHHWAPLPAGAFPALVLAQCLHYYAVLRLLPAGCAGWRGGSWQWVVLGLSAALGLGFVWDFSASRRLYAVASGLHAWLEWPVLLALLAGPGALSTWPSASPPAES
ncbi:MAG: hypothetical protein LWW92_02555 [Rhodocyclales bacterium]|nr:hypothetical protein [Rhodocyclales bacterium]